MRRGSALIAGLAGAALLLAGGACSTFSDSPANGAPDAPDASDASASALDDSPVDGPSNTPPVDAGPVGCTGQKTTLCIDFNGPDPQDGFVSGLASHLLPLLDKTGGGSGEVMTVAGHASPAFFATLPARGDAGASALYDKPDYPVGPLNDKKLLHAEMMFSIQAHATTSNEVLYFDVGVEYDEGTCRVALVENAKDMLFSFTCPIPIAAIAVPLPAIGAWTHVALDIDLTQARGALFFEGTKVAETGATGSAPKNLRDLYLRFGLEGTGAQSDTLRVGFDDIIVHFP